jgi:heme-degrading monooxygenase HmoA
MVVIVFRAKVRPDANLAPLEKMGARMSELAAAMPGFISYKDFAAADGESVSIVEFESLETLAAWRDHPEHKEVQRFAREHVFSEYRIQVCEPLRSYGFPVSDGHESG